MRGGAAAACAGQSRDEDAGTVGGEVLWGMARERAMALAGQRGAGPSGGETEGAVCAHGFFSLAGCFLLV